MNNQTAWTGRLLMIVAAALAVGTVGWLAVSGPTAGGALLCLVPAAVVCIALVMGGVYLNRQSVVEVAQTKSFEEQWQWREEERRARLYVADRLEQAAARVGANDAAPRPFLAELRGLAERLRRPGNEQGVPPTISADNFQALKSLDASLMAKADELDTATDRWLAGDQNALRDGASQLRQMVDRRTEVLLGDTQLKTAREVLAGEAKSSTPRGDVSALKLNDAVSAGGKDYTVSGRMLFDDRGVQWSRYQLRSGTEERWLLALNGGVDTYWLAPRDVPGGLFGSSGPAEVTGFTLRSQGTAEVTIEGMGGARRGLLIDYRRLVSQDDGLLWVERWPDGSLFAFEGERVGKYELEVYQQTK